MHTVGIDSDVSRIRAFVYAVRGFSWHLLHMHTPDNNMGIWQPRVALPRDASNYLSILPCMNTAGTYMSI